MIDAAEAVIFIACLSLLISSKLRSYLSTQLNQMFGTVSTSTSQMKLPFGTASEQLMITLGSLAFYVTRIKNLRLYPVNHTENQQFFKTMALGVLIGYFMDLDD
jgi:hypothetical protein